MTKISSIQSLCTNYITKTAKTAKTDQDSSYLNVAKNGLIGTGIGAGLGAGAAYVSGEMPVNQGALYGAIAGRGLATYVNNYNSGEIYAKRHTGKDPLTYGVLGAAATVPAGMLCIPFQDYLGRAIARNA